MFLGSNGVCVFHCALDVCIAQTIGRAPKTLDACILQCDLHASLEWSATSLDVDGDAAYRSGRLMPSSAPAPAIRDVVCRDARVRVSESGTGRPLLLLHDFLSDRDEWAAVVSSFAAEYRVIAVDLPGFGESEKPPPKRFAYDFDAFADAIVDVAAALDAAPLSLCGHGLGAAIAIALAERHPSTVERLVLVSPPLFGGRALSLSRAFAAPVVGGVFFKQLYGRRLFEWHFRRDVAAPSSPERLARLFDEFDAPAAREAAKATLDALLDTRTLEARLARVASPTLVAWGRSDSLAPAAHSKRLARGLPDARLELFDCGHSPAEEVPDAFAKRAMDFLAVKPAHGGGRGRIAIARRA